LLSGHARIKLFLKARAPKRKGGVIAAINSIGLLVSLSGGGGELSRLLVAGTGDAGVAGLW
jgi:hypothetical protein